MSFELIDTHCHIHDSAFSEKFQGKSPEHMIADAQAVGVSKLICVGTDPHSSLQAVAFCQERPNCFASIAIHPHEAEHMSKSDIDDEMQKLKDLAYSSHPHGIVAIGECGLDYFYHNDANVKKRQAYLLERHLELAIELDLPLIFHVRDAFADFFNIFDTIARGPTLSRRLRGVVHSFSASTQELDGVFKRGLYVGLNGIMTFTKDQKQLEAARAVPLERVVVETDAPFLTPTPLRGKMCEPKYVVHIAKFLSKLRGESYAEFAAATTHNAQQLFKI